MTLPAGRGALWALLVGNFVIGTGVMVVPGTLNDISASLGVTAATAGQLITAAALVMCIGAPLLAAVFARWDRRLLLTLTLVWYAVGHAVAAVSSGFGALLVVRMFTVIAPAVFTAQAAACAGQLVPATERGRAITFVFLGWSMASVLGLPIGALIGGHFGWRTAFNLIAVLSVIGAAAVWWTLPARIRPPALPASAWRSVFRSPVLMGIVGVTALQGGGQFVLFSYFAPLLQIRFGADAGTLSLLWACFGACGLAGNMLVSRYIDQVGAGRMVLVTTLGIAVSLVFWPFADSLLWVAVVLVPWGFGCFATNSAQQARLVTAAPLLAPASVALNSSAIYIGQAVGAGAGGWLLAHDRVSAMSWAGLVMVLGAIALSLSVDRRRPVR